MRILKPPPGEADLFALPAPDIVRPFPRRKAALYCLLCLLWLFFGLVGRDPWKPEETVLTAIVADMAENGLRAYPDFAGAPYVERPPLYLWLAALSARAAAPWLEAHEGARLVNVLLLLCGFALTWSACRRAHGVRAAWLSVLLTLGIAGLMIRAHLLTFGAPAFFGMALIVAGASALADTGRRRADTLKGGVLAGFGGAFLLLSVGWTAMGAGLFAVCGWLAARAPLAAAVVAVIVAGCVSPAVLWMLTVAETPPLALAAEKWRGAGVAFGALGDAARVAGWSLLPAAPLAAAGLWAERRALSPLGIFCAVACVAGLALFVLEGKNEEDLYFLAPPLAVLAARAARVMSDDIARVLDSFALLVIGLLFCGGAWLLWLALHAGAPAALADWLGREFPGFAPPPLSVGKSLLAAALTGGWLALIANFGRSNERAAVNWCCGVTLLWAIFNLLLVEYVDSGKSYRPPTVAIAARLGGECVLPPDNNHWRAQLRYFGAAVGGEECPYALVKAHTEGALWEGGRGGGATYYLVRR